MTVDLQAAYLFLLDRHNRGELNLNKLCIVGAGMGAMASQLGNVIVSSAPVERGSEVGGLQYTAQNLGSSLGTALIGAVVISSLATLTIEGIQASPALPEPTKQEITSSLGSGVEFVSDADVEAALTEAGLPPPEAEAAGEVYATARLDALRNGMVVLSLFCILALFIAGRLPRRALAEAATEEGAGVDAAAPARGP